MARTVTFNAPKTVAKQEIVDVPLTSVTIDRIVDVPDHRVVRVFIKEIPNHAIVLWSGDAYDAIGQWTDSDVDARMQEISFS